MKDLAEKDREIIALAEKSSQNEAVAQMRQQMKASVQQIGSYDSLRHTILSYVVEEQYDRAVSELERYAESKPEFPSFKLKCYRYIKHGQELVQAVKAKRNFPGWNALNMSKQRDLFDRAIEHFEALKVILTKIEVIEKEVRLEDARSTVWVVQAAMVCLAVLVIFFFFKEFFSTVIPTSGSLIDSSVDHFVDFICDKLGL